MAYTYHDYKKEIEDDIVKTLDEMMCQPILFAGSGLSRRYFGGPSWEELLSAMAMMCPLIDKEIAYFKQSYTNFIEIGEHFAEVFKEWAWGEGKNNFPADLFNPNENSQIYFKYCVANYFSQLTPNNIGGVDQSYKEELEALVKIRPHAIITTNYDELLENIFTDYERIIGQQVLYTSFSSIGEIYKIHGCSSSPKSIVLTQKDYSDFQAKKKYLSAKLLTYFAEHPLLLVGYSAEDPNIKAILSDIDEILASDNSLIPNIYILEWKKEISQDLIPPREKLINIDGSKSVRIKSIVANDFKWVFDAFSANEVLNDVSPKILRALMARTYNLVRCDIPKKAIEVDFQVLEKNATGAGELAKLYGITTIDGPQDVNASFPYSLTQIGQKMGYKTWHTPNNYLMKIADETGINLKENDNKYHITVKVGTSSYFHKYSDKLVEILNKIEKGEDYQLDYDE